MVQQALENVGLPPETITLGLIGGIVPSLLLVPSAWHLALAYENWLYKLLGRLGDGNLLVLWAIHLHPVAPFLLLYRWYTD
ncbi:hypothetical protein ACKVMT_05315 [Halobacteriales archaeon Cl-PHB]